MMNQSTSRSTSEGFKTLRLLMVLSSISPLFILLAIRGNSLVPDYYFEITCILLVAIPNFFLWLRIRIARRNEGIHQRMIGRSDNHSYHVLIYLLAILLPFYRQELDLWRELGAITAALILIALLFWIFNLHYMNLAFALFGYRVFIVHPPENAGPYTENISWMLITRRSNLLSGNRLAAYRISDTVYLEKEN